MAEEESTRETQDKPAVEEQAGATSAGQSPWEAHAASDGGGDPLPLVGAAFAGGFLLAKILKRLGGGDR
jgi:hypothetical protein